MKRFVFCGVLGASVVAAYVFYRSNQQVYSINIVGGGGGYYAPALQIGSPPYDIAAGVGRGVGMPAEWAIKNGGWTYTDFHVGSHWVALRGNYYNWLVRARNAGAALGIGMLFWIITTPRFRLNEARAFAVKRVESS